MTSKLTTVEDWLEALAGKRDVVTGLLKPTGWLGLEFKPIVSLARYDVGFLDSVTDHTCAGNPLTDRQAELALKILDKYQRQLTQKRLDCAAIVEKPKYRTALRKIDRTRTVSVEDNKIIMRFPYSQQLIDSVRNTGKQSQGSVSFDRDAKVWKLGLTEYNVSWVSTFAQVHEFETSAEFNTHMTLILEREQTPYEIKLNIGPAGVEITNAAADLVTYIEENLGGISLDNLLMLADYSAVLGYGIDTDLRTALDQEYGPDLMPLIERREHEMRSVDPTPTIQRVLKYAELTNRWPVVFYDPAGQFAGCNEAMPADSVIRLSNKSAHQPIEPHHRMVLTQQPIKDMTRIPLLVSYVGMIVGQTRRIMTDAADKIFYVTGKLA